MRMTVRIKDKAPIGDSCMYVIDLNNDIMDTVFFAYSVNDMFIPNGIKYYKPY